MKKISLTQGQFALVDDEDFERVSAFKWFAMKRKSGGFYAVRNIGKCPNQRLLLLHCEIMGCKGIDHISGDTLNCRRENMRPATKQQNMQAYQRKRANCTSLYRGVTWHKPRRKWCAQIRIGGVHFYLGLFKDEEDAARAYDKAAIEKGFFREALNFPLDPLLEMQ